MHILNNGGVVTYPYSPAQLRADNPQTSFPAEMPEDALADWGVHPVSISLPPAYDPETQRITEGVPEQVEGAWAQSWVVTDLTPEEIADAAVQAQAEYEAALDAHVEATAQQRLYKSAANCSGYVTSSVPAWAAEAQAFVAWRDAVYVAAFAALAAVQDGAPRPTVDDLIASLPAIVWPEAAP